MAVKKANNKDEDNFFGAYERLNPKQKEAVDAIEGPVMVVAGPGTGKTQILTLRIANILRQTDTAPAQILALTFTESGVSSMRRRLAELAGARAYAVVINTFHGFCNDIIKDYPEDFPRIIGSRHISEVEQAEILEKLILTLPLKLLRPFGDPTLYVRPALGAINNLKREGITVEEFKNVLITTRAELDNIPDLIHAKGAHKGKLKSEYQKRYREVDKNDELALIYEAYEQALATGKLYDYSDMIMEVLKTLQTNPNLLQILQEEHQYILVDEHQDTNNAQNKVIELLANFHHNPNLFVVGDEKQAIFRFQGASLENFRYFKNIYPEAKLIDLEDNYRSSQAILDSAHSLLPGKVALKAQAKYQTKPIKILAFPNPEAELYFVATDIKKRIESGEEASEIAVLYRNNNDAFPLARLLSKMGVNFAIESDQDLLSQIDVRKLIIIIEAVEKFGQPESLAALLHLDLFNLDPLAVYQIIREAKDQKTDLIDLIKNKSEFAPVYAKLSEWRQLASNDDLLSLMEKIVRDSDLIEQILTAGGDAGDRFAGIKRFYDEVAGLVESNPAATLTDWFNYLETIKKHGLLIKRAKPTTRLGLVRLMTAHRAKGLEFGAVYIIGAADGHWGGKRHRDLLKLVPAVYLPAKAPALPAGRLASEGGLNETDDQEADERRLFYVALTRAKQEVLISYSQTSESGRDLVPSSFIAEIKPELKAEIDTTDFNKKWEEDKAIIFAPATKSSVSLRNQEFIKELFLAQGLSVSALNNYLTCPWQYFYRNLIRLPETPSRPQLYGIAVHGALADFFNRALEKEWSEQLLLDLFQAHLLKQPLNQTDFNDLLAKGKESLAGWYTANHERWPRNVLTEFKIRGVLLTEDIRLTGVLDKIEFLTDGPEVKVVDYKTKQPMSRAAIQGETQTDDDGNYYRQLVFYKLLLNRYEDKKYLMQSAEIDFTEANQTSKYKSENFVITDEEVAELEELIKQSAGEILSLAFWDKRCDQKDCPYCALRELMK
jgi:DNA helicase-2/ATP-dependent DNA helicase PcrA